MITAVPLVWVNIQTYFMKEPRKIETNQSFTHSDFISRIGAQLVLVPDWSVEKIQ